MSKERIFELIRKEDMVLFVGAGMSLYAGYPSGSAFAKILYDNLTEDLKRDTEFTTDLAKLTEDIYNLKGGNKNYLFEMVKQEFQKPPTSTLTHQLLAKIPHFKTIITTNYDSLIEGNNKNIEVIRKSSDYAIANIKKQFLFKIHGDPTNTEKIILTSSDYQNYFTKTEDQTVFWNAVKDKLASSHILFVGYSMEDFNINVILEKIMTELGNARKEIFFVSPTITAPKLKYLERNGIVYIKATGETFVNEIYEDLKLNYFPGMDNGLGTANTAFNFANSNEIILDIKNENETLRINNAKSSNDGEGYTVNFTVDLPLGKRKEIWNSLRGKDFNDVILERESLKELNYFIKDIRIRNEIELQSLKLIKVPHFSGLVDIVFEDGFEVENYKIELFGAHPNDKERLLKIVVEGFKVIIKFGFDDPKDIQFNIDVIPDVPITSSTRGLKFYELLSRVVSNKKFKVYKKNKLIHTNTFHINFSEHALNAVQLKEYFKNLKKIETHFQVRFTNIDLTESNTNIVEAIIAYIEKSELKKPFKEYKFKTSDKAELEYLINYGGQDKLLIISSKEKLIVDLHHLQFDIGYLHEIVKDAFILNINELKAKTATEIVVNSKTNTIYNQFSDKDTILSEGKKL